MAIIHKVVQKAVRKAVRNIVQKATQKVVRKVVQKAFRKAVQKGDEKVLQKALQIAVQNAVQNAIWKTELYRLMRLSRPRANSWSYFYMDSGCELKWYHGQGGILDHFVHSPPVSVAVSFSNCIQFCSRVGV